MRFQLLALSALLTACSGGGGDESHKQPLVATTLDAGPDAPPSGGSGGAGAPTGTTQVVCVKSQSQFCTSPTKYSVAYTCTAESDPSAPPIALQNMEANCGTAGAAVPPGEVPPKCCTDLGQSFSYTY